MQVRRAREQVVPAHAKKQQLVADSIDCLNVGDWASQREDGRDSLGRAGYVVWDLKNSAYHMGMKK